MSRTQRVVGGGLVMATFAMVVLAGLLGCFGDDADCDPARNWAFVIYGLVVGMVMLWRAAVADSIYRFFAEYAVAFAGVQVIAWAT